VSDRAILIGGMIIICGGIAYLTATIFGPEYRFRAEPRAI
jgi:hypothetical protein